MNLSMPLPINIDDLRNPNVVENERVEFKEGWNPEPILHTMCAFANDLSNLGGGYIVVGVSEKDGLPVFPAKGVATNELDAIQKQLLNMCKVMQPPYFPQMGLANLKGVQVLVLWCPGGSARPYQAPQHYPAKEKNYRFFVRKYSNSIVATGDVQRELISLAAHVPFDDRPHPTAKLDDLSLKRAVTFLDAIGSQLSDQVPRLTKEEVFDRLLVLEGPPEHRRVRNVGLLMFCDKPNVHLPYAHIEVAWFPKGKAHDEFEERVFDGPLDEQYSQALSYIEQCSGADSERVMKHPDKSEATRFHSYPRAAIEEALANAIYHRDYQAREPIEIHILPERIIIHSATGPDPRVNMAKLSLGEASVGRYRNRRIGEFLKELKLTEGRGTGIPKIRKALSVNGSPEPMFETDDERSYFQVELFIHPLAKTSSDELSVVSEKGRMAQDVAQDAAQDATQDIQLNILEYCLDEPRTVEEILAHVGITERTGTFKRALKALGENGLLKLTIPDKPTSKNQKRMTTAKGRAHLEAQAKRGTHGRR